MFKPGDKLRVITNMKNRYKKGDIVTVDFIIPNTVMNIVLVEDLDKSSGWLSWRFELITPKYKVKKYGY